MFGFLDIRVEAAVVADQELGLGFQLRRMEEGFSRRDRRADGFFEKDVDVGVEQSLRDGDVRVVRGADYGCVWDIA